ncbi:MAG TPA: hypothetical protein DEA40_01255 [Parvularcula sp.]|nr:hypothetical protein [Parvularcula sp.]
MITTPKLSKSAPRPPGRSPSARHGAFAEIGEAVGAGYDNIIPASARRNLRGVIRIDEVVGGGADRCDASIAIRCGIDAAAGARRRAGEIVFKADIRELRGPELCKGRSVKEDRQFTIGDRERPRRAALSDRIPAEAAVIRIGRLKVRRGDKGS